MKLVKCENGHFFDNDKYAACPFCGKVQGQVTEPLNSTEVPELTLPGTEIEEPGRTIPEYTASEQTEGRQVSSAPENEAHAQTGSAEALEEQYAWREPAEPRKEEAVWHPAAGDNRTISFYERMIGTEPVVGWLVATEGPYFGEDFKLKSGRNFIGRSPEMDIQLGMDMSVSRRRHAVIIYEPHGKMFIAQPGDSRELFYLNGEVVLGNVQLKAYDTLQLGETKLLFIPLCGQEFSWDALKKEEL